ncbi:MAG: VWA domain-containing protein, partial [Deltaproteobacteria bacterium]|nr:VWA domain-containing protein [Deltaproteobacteria bacterium]
MNRTQGIFLFASIVVGLALVVTLRQPASSSISAPPPTSPPTSPHSARASDHAVDLAMLISHPYVTSDRETDVFLQVDLQGKTGPKTTRLPLDVGVVIDRSGSMAGAKLAHAKAAARRLVEHLHDGDHVAIVTYGSDVTLLVPSRRVDDTSRRQILATIDRITDRGGTFLSGGLRAAATALRHTFNGQHVTRIILISDGQANEGITTKPGLANLAQQTARGGISVTTMGVGLDFSEDVMTAIAEHGNGHYYFIKDSTSLAGIFDRELNKMMATVARRPRLQITLDPGVELVSLYGYDYSRHGQRLDLALPDLFAKQHRRVTLKLRIPKGLAIERPIARVALFYADANDHRQALASRI